MDAAHFVELVTKGAEQDVLAELERGPELAAARNAQSVSVICLAVYHGKHGLAAALAQRRSDLDIFEVSCVGHTARVREILVAAPDRVNAISPDGYSPLGYSAFFGHAELLRELIERGADVNAPSRNGMAVCPINSAAAHANQGKAVALVATLLDAGADPNARQNGGYTALHEAAYNGNIDMIRLLLDRGAEAKLATADGKLAIDIARSSEHAEAARVLASAV